MRRLFLLATLVLCSAAILPAQRRGMTIEDVLHIRSVAAPAVSPDGRQILYTVRGWAESPRTRERIDARQTIWRVESDGGVARQLTFGERGDSQPQWSPDGRWIAFLSAHGEGGDEEPRPQLHMMAASGGEPRKLLEVKEGVRAYAWSPDSARIAYVASDPRTDTVQAALRRRDDERRVEDDFRFAHLWVADVATGMRHG